MLDTVSSNIFRRVIKNAHVCTVFTRYNQDHSAGACKMTRYIKKALQITFAVGAICLLVFFILVTRRKCAHDCSQNTASKNTPSNINDIVSEALKETIRWSEDTKRSRPQNNTIHDKWIVVTSVSMPTEQVKNLSKIKGWKLIVVADLKTPDNWKSVYMHYTLYTYTQKHMHVTKFAKQRILRSLIHDRGDF